LEVFYDGEHYTGLAENVGQAKDNSVERALFQALVQCKLIESRETARYSRCGRTDKGVSAAGQVVALHVKSAFGPTVAWDAAGQDLLQEDDLPNCSLVAKRVWVTPRKATLGASGIRQEKNLNEMAYDQILNNLLPPTIRVLGWTPVSADFSARFSATGRIYRYLFRQRQLNVEKMRDGLAAMVGTHDFRNLCKLVRTYTCICIMLCICIHA
jgi:tRNA pseudouridine38/39 synthase